MRVLLERGEGRGVEGPIRWGADHRYDCAAGYWL